ncbi:formin-like protein 5 [Drosophila teissieri]|uniref:formin-like protein 5 n=1 Tax=Drosophila teissieri TaxID=7243 RepID=UPI001CB9EEC0|nr:formin-like protein 5 [Drosophila teissieri]
MSGRKECTWLRRLLLLICLGLLPARAITSSVPNPCPSSQVNVYGACNPTIVNVYNYQCGGQTGIVCNPSNSVTTVVPSTPGCPNTPQNPTVVPSTPGCPNTPQYPTEVPVVPSTPGCPNTPQYPTVVPVVPSTPGCPKTPQNPTEVPVVPSTPGCPNTPQYPTEVPVVPSTPGCPNTPQNPTEVPAVPSTPGCPNTPQYPTVVPENPVTVTPSYNASSTPQPTTTPPSVTEHPAPAPQPEPTPYPAPPPQITPPPTPIPVTTPPPPAPIMRCPEGTLLVKGVCRLLFCGEGALYSEGRCIRTRCPAGYVWTGIRCSKPQPLELGNIHIENTIHQLPGALPHLITNNVNNVKVNASIAIPGQVSEEEEDQEEVLAPHPPSGPCCKVFAPRVCTNQVDQVGYKCFSRSQQQCGSFCSANKVVLAPPAVATWTQSNNQMVVVPPNWAAQGCYSTYGACQQPQNFYDCSGCALGESSTCSSYCYSYKCSTHNCAYYDQAQYCSQYAGQIGCRPEDGWVPSA